MSFEYITSNTGILGGKPIIKDTRISVDFILQLIASDATIDDIVKKYPPPEKGSGSRGSIVCRESGKQRNPD